MRITYRIFLYLVVAAVKLVGGTGRGLWACHFLTAIKPEFQPYWSLDGLSPSFGRGFAKSVPESICFVIYIVNSKAYRF